MRLVYREIRVCSVYIHIDATERTILRDLNTAQEAGFVTNDRHLGNRPIKWKAVREISE